MEIIRGDTYNMPIIFKNSDGTAVDLTGTEIFFTVKKKNDLNQNDSEAVISKKISTHTVPIEGKSLLILSSSDTEIDQDEYIYDFQLKTAGGDIHSTTSGIFSVVNDVTKRTS